MQYEPMQNNKFLCFSLFRLSKMGGISSSKVAQGHQLWRPFSCLWLHAGVVHLIVNLLSLLFLGIRLEQEFGSCECSHFRAHFL